MTDSKQITSEVSLPHSHVRQICFADFGRVLLSDASHSLRRRSDKYGCMAGLGLTHLLSAVLSLLPHPLLLLSLLRALVINSLGKAVNPGRACCSWLDGISIIKAEIILLTANSQEWCHLMHARAANDFIAVAVELRQRCTKRQRCLMEASRSTLIGHPRGHGPLGGGVKACVLIRLAFMAQITC